MKNQRNNPDVIFRGAMRDWRIAEGEDIPDEHRKEYTIEIKHCSDTQFSLCIAPSGGNLDETPAMDVMIEIHEGVPALHISPSPGLDVAVNVHALPEGIVVASATNNPIESVSSKRIWPHLPEESIPIYKSD